MSKYEFVEGLQRALTGKVTAEKLQEVSLYYSDYIDGQINSGKSEEQVLAELGDPRLLAKTIVEAEKQKTAGTINGEKVEWEEAGTSTEKHGEGVKFQVNSFLFWLAVILIVLVVASLFMGLLGLFIRFVLPILLPVALIYMIIRHFQNK